MIFLKNLLKYLGFYAIFLILIIVICSILNLLGVNSTITNLILFIFNTILFFVFGFKNGKLTTSKGYLAGLKIGATFLLLLLIISLFLNKNMFSITSLIYYVILILSSLLGGMMGINKKSDK